MIDLSWGGYPNGSVPHSATSPIDSDGHRLEHTAAANFLAMQADCLHATGHTFTVAPGPDSANRTLAQEDADWAIYQHGGNTAAAPGTSNHGYARAVDITGYETATGGWQGNTYVNTGPVWQWLMANCARYGYSWATGQLSHESWHFESLATPGSHPVASASTGAVITLTPPAPHPQGDDNMKLLKGTTEAVVGEYEVHAYKTATGADAFSIGANATAFGVVTLTEDQTQTLISEAQARRAALVADVAAAVLAKLPAPAAAAPAAPVQNIDVKALAVSLAALLPPEVTAAQILTAIRSAHLSIS